MSAKTPNSGFTLLEALAAVVVVAIAVVGSLQSFASLSRGAAKAEQREMMQRLAFEKYDEEIATAPQQLANTSGDFADRNLPGYSWNMQVNATSVNDLMSVVVTVTKDSDGSSPNAVKGVAQGLYYQEQATSGVGTAGGAAGGAGGGAP